MSLRIENISFSYGKKTILHDVSFNVKQGEFVALVGPSGSGKSTLLHIIGGLLHPDSGAVYIEGEKVANKTGTISYMPQDAALFPWRTVVENVLLGQELTGEVEAERAIQLLRRAKLDHVVDAYPSELSGGMKQRVAFIRSLLCPQSILCLDEPFSALDAFTRLDMQTWLLDLWSEYDRSILFVTHDLDEAIFLADKIIVLSANPAKVKKIVPIPFPRPRRENLLHTERFFSLKGEILQLIMQLGE